jgi:hypothetical protein
MAGCLIAMTGRIITQSSTNNRPAAGSWVNRVDRPIASPILEAAARLPILASHTICLRLERRGGRPPSLPLPDLAKHD